MKSIRLDFQTEGIDAAEKVTVAVNETFKSMAEVFGDDLMADTEGYVTFSVQIDVSDETMWHTALKKAYNFMSVSGQCFSDLGIEYGTAVFEGASIWGDDISEDEEEAFAKYAYFTSETRYSIIAALVDIGCLKAELDEYLRNELTDPMQVSGVNHLLAILERTCERLELSEPSITQNTIQ